MGTVTQTRASRGSLALARRPLTQAQSKPPRLNADSYFRLAPCRTNTQNRFLPRIPSIRHLRKTRRFAAFSRFSGGIPSIDPIERDRLLEEMGLPPPKDYGGEPSQPRRNEARMRTIFRRRSHGLVLAALTLIVGLAERAQAQQSGLFPLAPIRRQRVPCDQQDPTYKIHKYQYFGYHPTCWKTFPAGWGCPSPEAPDKEASFRKQPFDAGTDLPQSNGENMERPLDLLPPEVPTLPGGQPSPFDTPSNVPDRRNAPPRGRDAVVPSPFELERRDPAPGAAPGAVPNAPRARDAAPPSPFDLEKKDQTPGAAPGAAPDAPRAERNRPTAAPAGAVGPELSAPTAPADRISRSRDRQTVPDDEIGIREDDGPVLALPNSIDLPPVDDSRSGFAVQAPQSVATTADPGSNPPASMGSSAPRRGFLSGLFSNLGLNWTRR
jgi:hypothetical protein